MPINSTRKKKQRNRPKVPIRTKVGVAAGVAGALWLGGTALSQHKARNPQTWWDQNPVAAKAARAGNSRLHDKHFLKTFFAEHPQGKAQSAKIIRHWDNILKIADTGKKGARKYNPLTVLDTLSRVHDLDYEISKINRSSFKDQKTAMRQYRRRELFRRVQQIPGYKQLMADLFELDSNTIRKARSIAYGKDGWRYGDFKKKPQPQIFSKKKKDQKKSPRKGKIMIANSGR